MLWTSLWVGIGSAIGGAARYLCSGAVARLIGETFPWGTLTVNVLGSALIGVFAAVTGTEGRWLMSSVARQFFMLGLFGGFTTFSSFSFQTLTLIQNGEWYRATGYVASSVFFCLLGVWLGYGLGIALNR